MSGMARAGKTLLGPADACLFTADVTQSACGAMVCVVTGAVTADTAPLLSQAFAIKCGDYHGCHLVIDLSGVTSLDADGLATLLVARHQHRIGHGAHLAMVLNPQSPTIAELYLVSLEACFEVHDTLAAALHACTTTVIDTRPDLVVRRPRRSTTLRRGTDSNG